MFVAMLVVSVCQYTTKIITNMNTQDEFKMQQKHFCLLMLVVML